MVLETKFYIKFIWYYIKQELRRDISLIRLLQHTRTIKNKW